MADKKRTFDRVVKFDIRSRRYPIRDLVGNKPLRSYSWKCDGWLDQGSEGACVGFGWSHDLIAKPVVDEVDTKFARALYKQAQTLDDDPGEDYSGTSVLAGAKALAAQGYMKEYRWAFGLEDLLQAVGHHGDAVLGINWYTGMDNPDKDGFVKVEGTVRGGHCLICLAVKLYKKDSTKQYTMDNIDLTKSYATLHNSWGKDWGVNGECKITLADLSRLLSEDGEACIPVVRVKK
jgi:hypothetical protein